MAINNTQCKLCTLFETPQNFYNSAHYSKAPSGFYAHLYKVLARFDCFFLKVHPKSEDEDSDHY